MIVDAEARTMLRTETDRSEESVAFRIIKDLAAELSSGELQLPSLPEVVVLIRAALDSEDCSAEQIADLVASEPILAGTLLKVANSVIYRRSGSETTSLVTGIARLGLKLVRSISMQFALQQLRRAEEFRRIQHLLDPEWERSRMVAGLCHALARRTRRAHPDEMLTLGLVHNIGRIYILSRCGLKMDSTQGEGAASGLIDDWHPIVGSAIAESWNLPEQAIQAIGQQSTPDEQQDYSHDINDLLGVAVAIAAGERNEDVDQEAIMQMPQAERLGVDADIIMAVREDAQEVGEMLAL